MTTRLLKPLGVGRFCVDFFSLELLFQFFTDPYFATMGGKGSRHIIGVEACQMHAPDFQAPLVMLNACHSGFVLARN